ncbi:MAG: restriction endonuclease subunit S, partial [Ruminococcus sp.]|nr:restriction endonuclease subunit S [Ruminococcus sp.]
MTKLEKLIEELCPGGVEYRKLKEVCDNIIVPMRDRPKVFDGDIPWCRIEDKEGQFFNGSKSGLAVSKEIVKKMNLKVFPTGTVICSCSASIGSYAINTQPLITNQTFIGLVCGKEIYNKFLLYFMETQTKTLLKKATTGTIPYISRNKFEELLVPVPPLEIQSEIVRILDNFTELTAELNEKLDAELTARKKQYEYYRDELLKPKDNIPIVTLKDIATDIYRGSGIKRDQVTEEGIPCVRYGEIYTTYNTWFDECVSHTKLEYVTSPKYFEYGDILFAITGESVEDIAKSIAYVGHNKCLAGGDIVVLKHNQNPRYLAHVLATKSAREQKSKGKVKSKVVHSNVPSIEKITIPLPSLDVQERYANVLDNFEQICNDLNIGLPAEIEARKKQYEFYRDLLLTFAEDGKTILT